MKRFFLLVGGLWLAIFLLPLMSPHEETLIPAAPQVEEQQIDANTEITLLTGGEVKKLKLDEYLQGVVAAEMPALFPDEALKAQAVAARTYTMKRASETPAQSHKGAMVCDDPNHCKAYKSLASFAANWGTSQGEYQEKICAAVSETDGEILLYDNEPISAVFHSSSADKTERAADVWGRDVPYLQSVDSIGDDAAPNYESKVHVSLDTFRAKVLETYAGANLTGAPEGWFQEIVRSDAGGVMTANVGGVNITGRQLRLMFGLRSTNFTVTASADGVDFATVGYGHGVGMSQYGARGLALQGMEYRAILQHYYTGTALGKIKQ